MAALGVAALGVAALGVAGAVWATAPAVRHREREANGDQAEGCVGVCAVVVHDISLKLHSETAALRVMMGSASGSIPI